jgi:hypothetical protein
MHRFVLSADPICTKYSIPAATVYILGRSPMILGARGAAAPPSEPGLYLDFDLNLDRQKNYYLLQ